MRTIGIGIIMLLMVSAPGPDSNADHKITKWPDNKRGAVSLTFDDGCRSQYVQGIPELERRGYKGTFFLITGSVKAWDHWQDAASSGHEIGSHTKTHPYLTRLQLPQVQDEMRGAMEQIDARIPQEKCILFAYPFGDLDPSVRSIAGKTYLVSRGGGIDCALNDDSVDFTNVKGCSPDDGNDIYGFTEAAERTGGWLVAIFHSLDGGKDCYGSWTFDAWKAYLDHLDSRELWVGPFGAAAKYFRERISATISVRSLSPEEITLSLTDTLDDAIYDEPLTIRSGIPRYWEKVIVQQGGSITEKEAEFEGEDRVIYYNAVPDRGLVSLRNFRAE